MLQLRLVVLAQNFVIRCDGFSKIGLEVRYNLCAFQVVTTPGTHGVGHLAN